jgi:CheY-like chemotaxis protein
VSGGLQGNGRLILVADDSSVQRLVLSRRLERLGFTVVTATDGGHALALVEARPPDAIITDMQMEPVDGLEFCRRLKADPRLAHIPVIVTSVSDLRSDNVDLAAAAGAFAYAVRTADLEPVLTALSRALP